MAVFDQRTTTLDLNGPVISWLTQPEEVATCGVATFTGIATATFPSQTPTNPATNTGSLAYQWYYKVGSATTVGELYDGDIAGLGLTSVSGTASTTLTVYGTYKGADSPITLENLKFFLRPDYTPSAYGTDDPITAGTARSTGNANNELQIDSNIVVCTQYPGIVITTQPITQTVPSTQTATFTVAGITTGNTADGLSYQWTVDGEDAVNGDNSRNVIVPVDPVNIDVPGWDGGNNRGNNIYYDTTGWTGSRQINFSTQEESGIYHTIKIDGIAHFPENYGSGTIAVAGGKIYKCYPTSSPANLHIGGDTPAGGGNQRLVIEEGGDDWNDMILDISGGGFFRTITSQPVISSGPTTQTITLTDSVSGAQDTSLNLTTSTAGIQTVNCKISHPTACNSPLYTNTVNFNVISSRQIINYELTSGDGSWYGSGEHNIFDSAKRFDASAAVMSRVLIVYAPEKDVVAKVTLAAGAGRASGSHSGGQGGLSQFYVTLKQNVEYVVKLGSSVQPSGGHGGGGGGSFFYKGGTVLVVVGGGGGAGTANKGGDGGGIGIGGQTGNGYRGGRGGQQYNNGQLPLQGFFAGGGWLPPIDYSSGNPGRLSACTFGQYWTGRGYSACQDMGYVKWYSSSGSEVSQSTNSIIRGYKSGLGHRNCGGNTSWSTGGGGAGAAGGAGSTSSRDGGGGGSGYSNGDSEIITTRLGGNGDQDGYVIFEV